MSEDLRKVSLPVSGMTCAACARWVEKALSGTAGVRAANVNLAAEKATVEYNPALVGPEDHAASDGDRSEEHTSELQSRQYLVCRLLLEKKKKYNSNNLTSHP